MHIEKELAQHEDKARHIYRSLKHYLTSSPFTSQYERVCVQKWKQYIKLNHNITKYEP